MATERTGVCREGCGACCRYMLLQVPPEYASHAGTADWLALHGVTLLAQAGGTFARLEIPCDALQPDGRCGLYGLPSRPSICADFPTEPRHLAGLEGACSYGFREVG